MSIRGNLDFCIAIRTVIMSEREGVRAGRRRHRDGFETQQLNTRETRDKAKRLVRALELRRQGSNIGDRRSRDRR